MSKIPLNIQSIPTPEQAYQDIILGSPVNDFVQKIDISLLDEIENQPFRINLNKIENYASSIAEYGLLEPVQVRAKENGRYEILAGRHRVRACKQLGFTQIDCIVKSVTDDNARLILLKTNTDREDDFLPSELGLAYREQEQLLKTSGDVRPTLKVNGENSSYRKKVYRFKRITYLIEPLLNKVDSGEIKLSVGAELSYLTQNGQEKLAEYILTKKQKISEKQAHALRELENTTAFTDDILEEFFHPTNTNKPVNNIQIKVKDIKQYIPKYVMNNGSYQEYIIQALQYYQRQQDIQ